MEPLPKSASYAERDLPAMHEILLHWRARGKRIPWPTPADLETVCHPVRTDWIKQVWRDATDTLVAFALLERHVGMLSIIMHPQSMTPKIVEATHQWGLAQWEALSTPGSALSCGVRAEDVLLRERLLSQGFQSTDRATLYFARDLRDPIPEPCIPPGFTIRPIAGEPEAPAYETLHRAAFGSTAQSVEEGVAARLALMCASTYQPTLDLVVEAPDGTLAAFCTGGFDAQENARWNEEEGWTDPIGTHPTFRQQGLARAVLLAALQRLRACGLRTAVFATGSWNVGMCRVGESVGFRRRSSVQWYMRSSAT